MTDIWHTDCSATTYTRLTADQKQRLHEGEEIDLACGFCQQEMTVTVRDVDEGNDPARSDAAARTGLVGTTPTEKPDPDPVPDDNPPETPELQPLTKQQAQIAGFGCVAVLVLLALVVYGGYKALSNIGGGGGGTSSRYSDDEICRALDRGDASGSDLVRALRSAGVEGSDPDVAAGLSLYVIENCPELSDELSNR